MTAIETIHAAIEKLEWLSAESTSVPWLVEEIPETGECRIISEFQVFDLQLGQLEAVAPGGMLHVDANLIVTLHNTIDAQLSILRAALVETDFVLSKAEKPYWHAAVALAREILWEEF